MDKFCNDKSSKIKAFSNACSVCGSLVKSCPLVALINQGLIIIYNTIVAVKGSFSRYQAYVKKR